jgi:hypothetical protein
MNTRITEALIKLMDKKKIGNIRLFVSDSLKFRVPRVAELLDDLMLKRENFTVFYAWNHSKIALIRCADKHIIFEGSGNFSQNAQFEQYLLMTSKKVYDFRLNCITNEFKPGPIGRN